MSEQLRAPGPVTFYPVDWNGAVRGWVWIDDDGSALGYVPRRAAGDLAFATGVAWTNRFDAALGRGLTPREALAEAADAPPRIGYGRVLLQEPGRAASVAEIRGRRGR
jgi:hypothetical protein